MIVLIVLDQLRADFVRHMPHLSRLAQRSLRFEACVTNGPLCRPARMTLMTGQHVHEHRQSTNQGVRPPTLPSHVRLIRDAGWHTAVVGKTHLHDGTGHLDDHRDVLHEWGYLDVLELPDPQAHWLQSAHSDFLGDKFERWRSYVVQEAERQECVLPDDAPWHLDAEDHLDHFCAMKAVERLSTLPQRSYFQVSFPGPHPPFDPPRAWFENVDLKSIPEPILTRTGPLSPVAKRYRARRRRTWSASQWQTLRAAYQAKVTFVDWCVGKVLEAVPPDAWIVVTSDHGELLVDHGVTGKVLPYEQATRVPLIVRPPGGMEARVDSGAVDHRDVVATLCELAGVERMGDASLVPRVRGERAPSKNVVFEAMGYVALRTNDATLAWDRQLEAPVELYDRKLDPQETHNAIHDSKRVGEMVQLLEQSGALA